jgi:hypothetical protein
LTTNQRDFPDWVKIPAKMQSQFFELAEKQAKNIKTKLLEDKKKLENLRRLLTFSQIDEDDEWKNWRIAVVDGSDSPVMSERIGGRFGTYGATYHIFQGLDLVEEEYYSGDYSEYQIGDPEASMKMLQILTVILERETAMDCLRKDVDLVIIDGSFFGFRPNSRKIHNQQIPSKPPKTGLKLVKHARDLSIKLLQSGKAIGIIKRVQSSALDGWTIYKNGNNNLQMNRNDKEILASMLKEGEWFSYQTAFEDPTIFNYYTRLALGYSRYAVDLERSIESIFKAVKADVDRNIKRDLACEPDLILKTARHYVRCAYPASPFCFETPIDFNLPPLLAFFKASVNKATGLPIQLDLTDQDVTIPAGFTREFVEEIEARLTKDPELDKYEIENHFGSLNPQKQE